MGQVGWWDKVPGVWCLETFVVCCLLVCYYEEMCPLGLVFLAILYIYRVLVCSCLSCCGRALNSFPENVLGLLVLLAVIFQLVHS